MQDTFFRQMFQPENKDKRNKIVAFLVLGILLLLCSNGIWSDKEEKMPIESETAEATNPKQEDVEEKMEQVLSKVEGAGKVQVMLTYSTTKEQILAREEKTEKSKGETEESLRMEDTLVLAENGQGSQEPVVLTEQAPKVEGVVIVAEGGDDAVVSSRLNCAAQALLDVPPHKIAILKMEQGGKKNVYN